MAQSAYDCIVIGSGPGGYVAAIRAAQLGKTTAVIESDKVGGRCLNYACIPAKALLRSADVLSEIRDSEEYGLKVSGVQVDYAAVQARRERVVNTLTSGVAGLFRKHEIDLVEGRASLSADGGVSVDGEAIGAGMVILATGSVPLAIPGTSFGGRVIGTEEVYALPELPARLAVVGAGASGAEIASAFARLGSEVLLLEALERVLPTEDADISRLVERGLLRSHRGAGHRPGLRGGHRQGALRRGRRRHRVRRPHGPHQARGRAPLRRAARRAHRRQPRHRADPGAGQRARARGRLRGGGAHRARPPHAVGGRDGGGAGGRRLADPRLTLRARRWR